MKHVSYNRQLLSRFTLLLLLSYDISINIKQTSPVSQKTKGTTNNLKAQWQIAVEYKQTSPLCFIQLHWYQTRKQKNYTYNTKYFTKLEQRHHIVGMVALRFKSW